MSQRVVESILGRLITDGQFRERFFVQPALVCRDNALDLTQGELAALLRLNEPVLRNVASSLDPKIVRAATVEGGHADVSTVMDSTRPRRGGRGAAGLH